MMVGSVVILESPFAQIECTSVGFVVLRDMNTSLGCHS
jgi:hypothetical protein